MKISNTFIKKDFPVSMYKGRVILQEDGETFDDIIKDAKKQIDAEIEEEINEICRKFINSWRFY